MGDDYFDFTKEKNLIVICESPLYRLFSYDHISIKHKFLFKKVSYVYFNLRKDETLYVSWIAEFVS